MTQRTSILVAMTPDRVIGRGGALPWHLPADLRRFKRLTMGHHIIMGRKTFESLTRELPGRTMIILTRQRAETSCASRRVHSLDEALTASKGDDEVFVVGGAAVYREALPRADRIYQTLVHANVPGDTWFPEFAELEWQVVEQEHQDADARNEYPMTFRVLDRT